MANFLQNIYFSDINNTVINENIIKGYTNDDDDYISYHQMAVLSLDKYENLEECIRKEDFKTLKDVFNQYGDIACAKNLTSIAAEINRLDILQFLIEQGCCWSSDVLLYATKHNNVEMIDYCINTPSYDEDSFMHGLVVTLERCPWNPQCINYLSKFNQTNYLELMYKLYSPSLFREGKQFWSKLTLKDCNNLSFLEFYLQHNINWNCLDIIEFIEKGNLEAVQMFYTYYKLYKEEHPEQIINNLFNQNNFFHNGNNNGFNPRINNGVVSKSKWSSYLLEKAIYFNQFDIVRFLIETKLNIYDDILRVLNNNAYQIYKLCFNLVPTRTIKYKQETSSKFWIDFISSLDKQQIEKLELYSLLELYEDIIVDLQQKYCIIKYEDYITKDVIKYCVFEYL